MGHLRRIAGICFVALWCSASVAQEVAPIDRMMKALRIADTIEVMREEGRGYGEDVAAEMLPDADAERWQKTVMRIHDPERMRRLIRQGLETALTTVEMQEVTAFYNGDPGAEIVALEVAARRAFLDANIEEQARARHAAEDPEESRLRAQVDQMIAESDLIERNVAGAMNATMMFYRGLMDAGALDMTQDDMLADLWSQEETFRADSESWLGGFLLMAYDPLPEEDLNRYLTFWRSDAGRALNSGLFMAFDRMYEELSYLMGQAVAQHMQSEKL